MEKDLIEKLKSLFEKEKYIRMAFLFGSAAKAREMSESDVDVAVWTKEDCLPEKIDALWNEVIKLVHREVDFVLLNNARPTVAWAAMRGIPLLIRDYKFYLDKMLEISSEAEDFQDFTIDLFRMRQKLKAAT